MPLISRLRNRCYCAFCKTERKVYSKKHVDLTNVLGASFLATSLSYLYWGELDPRGLMLFGVLILVAEVFVYSRWRSSLVCKMCGFDPIMYKRSPQEASKAVREFFTDNAHKPGFQLSRSPLLEVHKQQRAQERKKQELRYIESKMQAKRDSGLTPTKTV